MNKARFKGFRVVVGESDLWIGVNRNDWNPKMESAAWKCVVEIRSLLEEYIFRFPEFRDSFDPVPVLGNDSSVITLMKDAGFAAGTGPMASVAGMVAQETGLYLSAKFDLTEIVVENGGDIYLQVVSPVVTRIDAGRNTNFGRIGLVIPPEMSPVGVCTSSGMFGHSVSLGQADSVTVVSSSAYLADAFATGIANQIHTSDDIGVVTETSFTADMLSLVCIKDDQIGIKGNLKLGKTN
ncbi:MAG TPA: UPF0280 family protein [Bacteroidales bacterium]|nr:UPF0280 family protein [Bacteroidales bacterium]